MKLSFTDPACLRKIIEGCLRRELSPDQSLPKDTEDLLQSGALDSMGWVAVIRCIEATTGICDLGSGLADQPANIGKLIETIQSAGPSAEPHKEQSASRNSVAGVATEILGWGHVLGSVVVRVAELEREFDLPPGKLALRAGIESVRRAAKPENEINLGAGAARSALAVAQVSAGELDYILATSETFLGYPSLGAELHSRLLAREICGVLDIGGACLGLINSFVLAHSLIVAGRANKILVVSADVHSRVLGPGRVPGEFGGLFGDGASAFVIAAAKTESNVTRYRLGEFVFGCSGTYAAAIRLTPSATHGIDLDFNGEALSRAAVTRLEQIIADLELRAGVSRHSAAAFATHQPNPRLLDLLARQMKVPPEKFPAVAKICGNLGAGTCGVALSLALTAERSTSVQPSRPIFLASLGPGLLWGGGLLEGANHD